jgi:hypothetical protein
MPTKSSILAFCIFVLGGLVMINYGSGNLFGIQPLEPGIHDKMAGYALVAVSIFWLFFPEITSKYKQGGR